jgi:hypothetical protein
LYAKLAPHYEGYDAGIRELPLKELALNNKWMVSAGQNYMPDDDVSVPLVKDTVLRMKYKMPGMIECFGNTGSGKSSFAISYADMICRLAGKRFVIKDHMFDDLNTMITYLSDNGDKLVPHDVYICDEMSKGNVGFGAGGAAVFTKDFEARMRALGVWVIKCSYKINDPVTHFKFYPMGMVRMQGTPERLEMIRAMVYFNLGFDVSDVPLGYVYMPVAKDLLYDDYFAKGGFKSDILSRDHRIYDTGAQALVKKRRAAAEKFAKDPEYLKMTVAAEKNDYVQLNYQGTTKECQNIRQIADMIVKRNQEGEAATSPLPLRAERNEKQSHSEPRTRPHSASTPRREVPPEGKNADSAPRIILRPAQNCLRTYETKRTFSKQRIKKK